MRPKLNQPVVLTFLDFVNQVGLNRRTVKMIKNRNGNSKYRPHQGKKEIEKHRLRLEKKRNAVG